MMKMITASLHAVKKTCKPAFDAFLLVGIAATVPFLETFPGYCLYISAVAALVIINVKGIVHRLSLIQDAWLRFGLCALGIFVLGMAVQSIRGDKAVFVLEQWEKIGAGILILAAVLATDLSEQQYKAVVLALIAGCLAASAVGVAGYLHTGRSTGGVFVNMNPNKFAGLLVAVCPITLGWAFASRGIRKLLPFLSFGFILIALVFTECRGALLSAFVSLVFLTIVNQRYLVWLPVIGLAILSPALSPALATKILTTFNGGWGHATMIQRLTLWQAALNIFKHQPLWGAGAGNFRVMAGRYGLPESYLGSEGVSALSAHNSYLEILAEQGLIGLLALLMFIGFCLAAVWRHARRANHIWVLSLLAGSIGFYCQNLTNSLLLYSYASIAAWLILGISLRLAMGDLSEK